MKNLLSIILITLVCFASLGQMRNDLSACKKYDLVNFNSAQDSVVYVCVGDVMEGDSYTRFYVYIQNSTATADGENVLASTGMFNVGRYVKIPQPQADWNQSTATAIDYIKNKPALKSVSRYEGTTNSSGNYTVTFGTAYASTPNIQANIVGGTNTQIIKITSVATTGFTVNVTNRTDVAGLLPTYSNVNAALVHVLITGN